MQVLVISKPRNVEEARLLRSHHQLRARVLSDRLGWDVDVTADYESDCFDALKPTYILAVSDAGQLVGCARLLPALGPTMLTGVFSSLLPGEGLQAHTGMIESSRFCVDTSIEEGRGGGSVHQTTLITFACIIVWCLANRFTEIVKMTDLRFERLLARVGWPLQRSFQSKGTSRTGSKQLAARPLIHPHEVLRMRADEQIIFTAGNPPLRCGRAIWLRREDMKACVDANRFHIIAQDV